MECFKCGISGDRALLFDAISDMGIIKICEKCSFEEDMPIIKKPSNSQIRERKQTVHELLSKIAGIDPKDRESKKEKELLRKQETSLRDLVDKKYQEKIKDAVPKDDLINNFHWIIMRTRRLKKLTQAQLAEAIAEPEAAIKMAEQGVTPNNKLVKKIEDYLGINLRKEPIIKPEPVAEEKPEESKFEKEKGPRELSFDPETTKTLTISDLQEMKKKKEKGIFERPGFKEEEKPEFVEKKEEDLSDEDIDDILFERKT